MEILDIDPIQDGRAQKGPPTSFSPETYKLVWKRFWLLVLNFLPHWCKISRPYLVPVLNC